MPEATPAPRSVPPAGRTAPALLAWAAAAEPDRHLLTLGETRRTRAQMVDAVARVGGTLRAAGVEAGDRVLVMCSNRIELLDLILGCGWIGATAVPLNTAARGEQLRHMVHTARPRLVVVEDAHAAALPPLDGLAEHDATWVIGDVAQAGIDGAVAMPAPGEPVPAADVDPGDPLVILFTSGTTGASKGVLCPHAQFHWWAVLVGELLEIEPGDVLFSTLPLFHTNALNAFFQALGNGASFALAERFSASRFWAQAREHGATVTYLLGAMVNILSKAEPSAADRDHTVRVALSPATPPWLKDEFHERFGMTLVEAYGSTELNLVIGSGPSDQRPGTIGRALPEYDAIVADEHDVPVPDGEAGELLVRPREPYLMATGYFDNAAATVAAWRNLWFHTGDRVVRDPDGWFRFLDRTKDAIRRRGENISSFEVEEAIATHPAVEAVAVFPVPSEMAEDEVMAAVVVRAGQTLDPVDLMRHCEPRLAYFAIPRYVDLVASLPLTANGKPRKAALRERGVTEATWDREAAGYQLSRTAT